ncbi:ATP-binding cassette sub-family G member 4-like isoform X3 [Temnothorax nylanderi]|uniref:ATP-binding cassette sub-family G member 4-like isoform X3 n=1 Tax=Temnothorax nylanderi TaxID=102681 RepID=UPI003A882958
MLEANGAAKMLDDDSCKISLRESEKLLGPEKAWDSQMCIEFSDLCYSVRRNRKGAEKTILRNVTGHFESGKLTVIIGPSGAGKTTLLKVVSGERLTDVKGIVTVNGVERDRGMLRKQVCYVPQQFDLLPFLTTRETLYIAARLKLDVNQDEQVIRLIVNDIAESLSLSNCLDTLVKKLSGGERKRLSIGAEIITKPSVLLLDEPTSGLDSAASNQVNDIAESLSLSNSLDTLAKKLSGGERKRLSIGVEMITKPSVLLLDEPTSGLDSAASNQLVNMLHGMARENCTVVCAIHQPSSQMISLFDDIMVLNQGRSMYCGPKSEILNTYSVAGFTCPSFYNIAEFVLEVITEQRGGDLENLHRICRDEYEKLRSRNKRNENESTDSKQKCETGDTDTSTNCIIPKKSTWQQQKILFLRSLIYIKRDNTLTKLRFAAHVVNGLLLGTVFYNFGDDAEKVLSNTACLFFFLLFLFFANAMPTVQMFPTEATVFLQEYLNNWYSLRAYYSVKILTDLPLQILCASSFLFTAYYMTGQPMEYVRILQMWSVCLLITILGQTVGILTGAAFGTESGFFLIPAVSTPLLLFAGYFLKFREISVYLQPLSTLSFFRYTFEGMMQAVYLNRSDLSCSEIYCYLRSPNKILSMMDMPTVPFYVILIVLSSWILCLHIITYALLRWKVYYARK